jgi:hypothetical protein
MRKRTGLIIGLAGLVGAGALTYTLRNELFQINRNAGVASLSIAEKEDYVQILCKEGAKDISVYRDGEKIFHKDLGLRPCSHMGKDMIYPLGISVSMEKKLEPGRYGVEIRGVSGKVYRDKIVK